MVLSNHSAWPSACGRYVVAVTCMTLCSTHCCEEFVYGLCFVVCTKIRLCAVYNKAMVYEEVYNMLACHFRCQD